MKETVATPADQRHRSHGTGKTARIVILKRVQNLDEDVAEVCAMAGHEVRILAGFASWSHKLHVLASADVLLLAYVTATWSVWLHLAIARLLGVQTLALWVGSDVLQYGSAPAGLRRAMGWAICRHVAVAERLLPELEELGVRATVAPLLPRRLSGSELVPLPETPAVLAYVVPGREDLYGWSWITEFARRFTGLPFLILPPRGEALHLKGPPNVHILPDKVDMDALYRRVSVLLRPTLHDGCPRMILEALGFGRYVIVRYPFPEAHVCRDLAEAEKALETILELREPNRQGHRYAQEFYAAHHGALAAAIVPWKL